MTPISGACASRRTLAPHGRRRDPPEPFRGAASRSTISPSSGPGTRPSLSNVVDTQGRNPGPAGGGDVSSYLVLAQRIGNDGGVVAAQRCRGRRQRIIYCCLGEISLTSGHVGGKAGRRSRTRLRRFERANPASTRSRSSPMQVVRLMGARRMTQSIYEVAGGRNAFVSLAHAWHARCLADPIVSHAFSHGYHPQHSERLAAYWAEALGGPSDYTKSMGDKSSVVRLHSGNGEHVEMDERAQICFAQALDDAGLPNDPRLRAALKAYFRWATEAMSAFPHSTDDVPAGLALGRWSWDGPV